MAARTFKPQECGQYKDIVAPRDQQPVQTDEWPGLISSKFNGSKAHIPQPAVD
jgi:hypothetical protein